MQGFRRLLRRFIKPAAMVGAVGILSVSLIVTTPSNAHAFSDGDLIAKMAPRVAGAVKTIAPVAGTVAAVATSVTPTGWALKAGWALLSLAFSTSDVWVPWLLKQGASFGQGSNPNNVKATAPEASNWIDPNVSMTSLSRDPAQLYTAIIEVQTVAPTHTSAVNYFISTYLECNSKQDGTGVKYIYRWTPNSAYSATSARTQTFRTGCDNGFLIGIIAGPTYGTPELTQAAGAGKGPTNVMRWGTLAQTGTTGGFDPASSSVGYQGKSECIDSAGTVSWISGPVISGSAGGVQMPSCEAAGRGHGTGRTQVIAFKPDGTQEPVWDVPVAPSDPSTPLCDPGKSSGGCVLSVELDGHPCEAGNVECENWSEIQKNDPNNTRLKCRFGPYTLPMSACNLLEQAYRIGGALATELNTDGDPATQDNTNYAGQPVPQPAPGPVSTGTGTGTGTAPSPGAQGQPSPSADAPSRSCWPTGWAAFNPLEWVLKPLGCAFIPTRDIDSRNKALAARASVKAPMSWLNMPMTGPGGGGCPNWVVKVDNLSKNVVCESSFTGAITGARGSLFGIVAAAMIWPLLRSLWYAAIPILRVTPSSGGK